MPLTNEIAIEESTQSSYETIPAGIYQIILDDVEERESTNYKTKEPETQLMFRARVIEEGDHFGHSLGIFARPKWFSGGSSLSASKLYSLVKAVYGHYHKDTDIDVLTIADINMSFINDLLGKQLMVAVDVRKGKDGSDRNRITSFTPIKKEIAVEQEVSEDVDPDDIPF